MADKCLRCWENPAMEGNRFCQTCHEDFCLKAEGRIKEAPDKAETKLKTLLKFYMTEKARLENELNCHASLVARYSLSLKDLNECITELKEILK